jgi:ribonuclease D
MTKTKMLHDLMLDPITSWDEWRAVWNGAMSFDQRMGLLHGIFTSVIELRNVYNTLEDDLDYEQRIVFLLGLCEDYEQRCDRSPAAEAGWRKESIRATSLYRKAQAVLALSVWREFRSDGREVPRFFSPIVIKALVKHFRRDPDTWRPANLPPYENVTRDSRTEKAWWAFATELASYPLKWSNLPTYPDDQIVEIRHQELFDHRMSLMHILVAAGKSRVFLDYVANLSLAEIEYLGTLATRGGEAPNIEAVAASRHESPERELAQTMIVIEAIRGLRRLDGM